MANTINRYTVSALDAPVHGYTHIVQEWTSVDGGETYYHTGNARYFASESEALAYLDAVRGHDAKRISINNGMSYTTPEEALEALGLDVLAHYMDDNTREALHYALAPCTDLEFLRGYLELAPCDLVVG